MRAKQISVFIENKRGRLSDVTHVLKNAGINIRVLSLADTADFGILRMIVDKVEKTMQVLKENDFTVMLNDVLAVQIVDRAGSLADLLQELSEKSINVEYMYAFAGKEPGTAIMILRIEDIENGLKILENNKEISVITAESLANL